MTASELLAEFPAIPNPNDYVSPEAYLADTMTSARWFIDHADDIRQVIADASIEWIGSRAAREVAARHGVNVTAAALWKAAADNGYIEYKTDIDGRHLYDKASVDNWASTRKYHRVGPRTQYG